MKKLQYTEKTNNMSIFNLINLASASLTRFGLMLAKITTYSTKPHSGNEHAITYLDKPIHFAAAISDVERITALAREGADLEALNSKEMTPLCIAAHSGHTDTIQVLINLGAEVNLSDRDINLITPLHYAAICGHTDVIQLLIKFGGKVNPGTKGFPTPVYLAAEKGHNDTVRVLVEMGADVNAPQSIYNKSTSLHIAAKNGHTDTLTVLINSNADVTAKDRDGETPLFYAVRHGHSDIITTLVDSGAKVNERDNERKTPLYTALDHECSNEVIDTLYRLGAIL